MTRLVIVACASMGLILFLAFFVARLVRSRQSGLSIRMQVFLALSGVVFAFAFGLGLMVIDRIESRAVRLARAAATDEALTMSSLLESELSRTPNGITGLAQNLERWKLHLKTRPQDPPRLNQTSEFQLLNEHGQRIYPRKLPALPRDSATVKVEVPLRADSQVVGKVRVIKPTVMIEALLADFAPTVLVISLLLGAVAAWAAIWIGRSIAAPIEALSRYAERVASGERRALPALASGREVTRLVESIGKMQKQLEGRPFVETFAADLSHELKNPVAAILASAEVLEDGALEEPEQAQRFVFRIREAAGRIEKLLAELLNLATIETRGAERLENLALPKLLEELVDGLQAGDRLQLEPVLPCTVRGDRFWLGRALENLLENALLHSPAESQVRLSARQEDREIVLEIESEGQVAPHVREQLFQRFVTTRRERGGTGLGLSIVRAVAEAHHGEVKLVLSGPPKVRFELRLPRPLGVF